MIDIPGNDLLRLLESAASRLSLLVLASCSSAGAAFDRPHRQLATPENRVPEREPSLEVPVFGSVIADKAGCAVVAMRFPVPDEYAISLSLHLYRRLIVDRQPLTLGLRAAVGDTVSGTDVLGRVTPVLLGTGCGRIVFRAATLPHDLADASCGLSGAGTANLPDTFVGRADVAGRVVAALAPGGKARHWLHHMLGTGGNEITRAFLLIADGRERDIDTAAMSPVHEYIVDITRRMIAGETHIVFATTPPWDNPDLDVIESGSRALMNFAQGVAHDQGAITAYLELLDRSGGQAFARALRLFMAGERSRLLAVDLPSEDATVMVRLIKLSAIGGKDQEDRD